MGVSCAKFKISERKGSFDRVVPDYSGENQNFPSGFEKLCDRSIGISNVSRTF